MNEPIGWKCPRCNRINNPILMTCECSFKYAHEYPVYPANPFIVYPNKGRLCAYCNTWVLDGNYHTCVTCVPGVTTTITGSNLCNVCHEMYPIGGTHSCGGGVPSSSL